MIYIKKIAFALPLLIFSFLLFQSLPSLIQNLDSIFGLSLNTLLPLLTLVIYILLTSTSFIIFTTLASDWKFILPIIIIVSSLPILFFDFPSSLVLGLGILGLLTFTNFTLTQKLKSYLTFSTTTLLIPSISQITTLLILVISLSFYISTSTDIKTNGFKIPDSLLEASLQIGKSQLPQEEASSLPELTPDQLQLLKQNPEVLKQYGVDPQILDQINSSAGKKLDQTAFMKAAVSKQFESIINPYLDFIAPILAILFFFSLNSLAALISITLRPLIWLIFLILEKTNFVHFEVEMREVKKLVV